MRKLLFKLLDRILASRLDRRIYIFQGRECWAVRYPKLGWYIKTAQCNMCGKCCEAKPEWFLGVKEIEGKLYCQYLNKRGDKWACEAGPIAPFSCCRDNALELAHKDCSIRYERV